MDGMADDKKEMEGALQSQMRAVSRAGRKGEPAKPAAGEPKIGVEEFMSVAERFGFSPETLRTIRQALEQEDWGEGPFLANYYSGLPQSKVQAFEEAAREIFRHGRFAQRLRRGRRGTRDGGDLPGDRVLRNRGGGRHLGGSARVLRCGRIAGH
jgi:hypothetical protein